MARQRREARETTTVSVGIHDRRVGTLAAQLEFGNPSTGLPERPAFRQGLGEAGRAFVTATKAGGTPAQAGKAAADEIKRSYLRFDGPGLSELQKSRKEGTAFQNRELVGREGPRLVSRIGVEVDGKPVV